MKKVNPYPIILKLLSQGRWYAPHEVRAELRKSKYKGSHDAITARIRDLRKDRYGDYDVRSRRRAGTTFFEYRIELQQSLDLAA